jgi:hypothetical protein
MVSPAQLVETISRATGVALPTVVDIDRKLAKAGLRTVGGRGRSAARMTAADAARLLTAILASAQATDAADAVQRYVATSFDKERLSKPSLAVLFENDRPPLRVRQSFVEALEALIVWAAKAGSSAPSIEVFAFTRATYGRIRLTGSAKEAMIVAEYLQAKRATADDEPGDLEQSRRITGRTILTVARLLADGETT